MQHRVSPQVCLFIESFCTLKCLNKCTIIRIFKCNSFFTSITPLISTWNWPSWSSLNKSQSRPLGVLSDAPSIEFSISITIVPSSAPSRASSSRQVRHFCHLFMHFWWFVIVNSKVNLQVQRWLHHEVHIAASDH